jgi:hypothetical protein
MSEEVLEEYDYLTELRVAKAEEASEPTMPLQDVRMELGLNE